MPEAFAEASPVVLSPLMGREEAAGIARQRARRTEAARVVHAPEILNSRDP